MNNPSMLLPLKVTLPLSSLDTALAFTLSRGPTFQVKLIKKCSGLRTFIGISNTRSLTMKNANYLHISSLARDHGSRKKGSAIIYLIMNKVTISLERCAYLNFSGELTTKKRIQAKNLRI